MWHFDIIEFKLAIFKLKYAYIDQIISKRAELKFSLTLKKAKLKIKKKKYEEH